MRRNALPRSERLRGKVKFSRLFAEGRTLVLPDKSLRAIYLVEHEPVKAGVGFAPVISKKIGPAVHRNRLKRLMRTAFRTNKQELISVCYQKEIFVMFVILPGSYPKTDTIAFLEAAIPAAVPGILQSLTGKVK